MKRFIRVIMGLFIMLAILNPIIDLVQNREELASQIPALSTNSGNSAVMMNEASSVNTEREKISLELYKKELAQQIKILVLTIDGVADANVVVEINPNNNHNLTSVINNVVLYIKPGVSGNLKKIENISKVSIGEPDKSKVELHKELQKKVVQMLTELYQIPKEKIEVRLLYS